MIVWINGPFGGGKTQLAALLHQALSGSVVADPEEVGSLLRRSIADHPTRAADYQGYPAWRALTVHLVTELHRHTGGPVLVPMTVLDEGYADELFGPLRTLDAHFHHLVLHAERVALAERIEASREYPGDATRSEAVRIHRRRRAVDYRHAADTWLHRSGHVIDTTTYTPGQTLQSALALLHTTS
ncbi:AAA family ATPase [Streptomyces sp. NPDC102441]|uniref:AAA family ATPase n=1 Tax=Streptomyces sp. NPDC102441 TaxID=3366176 RepID=UPI00381DDCC8